MKRRLTLGVCLVLVLSLFCPAAAAEADPRFAGKTLAEVVDAFRTEEGLNEENFALSYYNTVTGEEYAFNDTKMMVAASTFKLPLNLYYYKQELEGAISPDVLIKDDTPLWECHYQSIVHSNNDLSIAMLYRIGEFRTYKQVMRDTFFDMADEEIDYLYYVDNYYCTRMMLQTLRYLYDHAADYQQMLDYLLEAKPGMYFKRYVTECDVAHKFGSFEGAENDVGIIYANQPFLLVVYTQNLIGEEVCAQAARLLKDYTDYHTEAPTAQPLPPEEQPSNAIDFQQRPSAEPERAPTPQVEDLPAEYAEPTPPGQLSVGIIGSADGPTAVFVAGDPFQLAITAGLALVLVILLALLIVELVRRRKDRK